MNNNDFDEIGRRLRNMEAEPPKEGWKRIAPVIASVPGAGKVSWIRKNWWKPFAVAVPVAVVTWLYIDGSTQTNSTSLINTIGSESTQNKADTIVRDNKAVPAEALEIQGHSESIAGQTDALEKRATLHSKALPSRNQIRLAITGEERMDKAQATDSSSEADESALRLVEGLDRRIEPLVITAIESDGVSERQFLSTSTIATEPDSGERVLMLAAEGERGDSVQVVRVPPAPDSLATPSRPDTNKESQRRNWRLSASYLPLFLKNRIDPVKNDDLLITNVKSGNKLHYAGYSVNVGAGLAVSSGLYIDAHFSYLQLEQRTRYAYSNGDVDTLIATQLPDQTVVVSPVYHTYNAEVQGKYTYGGLRLSGTYYMWSNERRRVNIGVSFGSYYLLSADVSEKTHGTWTAVPEASVHRWNHSVSVSAGYSRVFGRGLEFLINPTLTHYFGNTGNGRLPYSQTQSSVGLNLAVFKTIQ